MSNNEGLLKQIDLFTDHEKEIYSIFVCNKLNVIATVSSDKTCNLYIYPSNKLYRVIKTENIFEYVFLSSSPIPSVILYSRQECEFHSYSINGDFMNSDIDVVKYLFSPLVITDNSQQDYLVNIIFI
jgi:hypothetical protein